MEEKEQDTAALMLTWLREMARELHGHHVSTCSTKAVPSAEMCISCLTNRAKTTSSERSNFDANQMTAIPINLKKQT